MKPEFSEGTRVERVTGDGLDWVVDLVAVVAALIVGGAVALTAPSPLADGVRVLVTLPVVLLLPGYALLAAAFPQPGGTAAANLGESVSRWRAPTARERLALAPGFSLLLIPLVTLPLSALLGRFDARVTVGALAALVLLGCVVAAVRRLQQPEADRFALPAGAWLEGQPFDTGNPRELAATLLLAVSIVAAVGVVGYAAADTNGGASYTDMYLATESGGEYTIGNYPETLVVGEPTTLHVGIENNERRQATYSIVVLAQRVDTSGPRTTVLAQREVDRATATVAAGETAHVETTVTPTRLGTDIRLTYLLYRGQPTDTLNTDTAYRYTYVWVDVVEADD